MSTRAACARRVAAYVGGLVGAAGLWVVLSALLGATPAQADEAVPDPRLHEPDGPVSEVVDHVVRDRVRPAVRAATESSDAAVREAVRAVTTVAPQASPTTEAVVDRVVDPATDRIAPAVGAAGSEVVEAAEAAEQVTAELLPTQPEPTEPGGSRPAAAAVDGWAQGVAGSTQRAGSGQFLTSVPAGDPVPAVVPGLDEASSIQAAAPSDRALPAEPVDDDTSAGALCVAAGGSSASSSGAGGAGSLGVVPTRSLVSAPAFWSGPVALSPALVPAPDGLPDCTPD